MRHLGSSFFFLLFPRFPQMWNRRKHLLLSSLYCLRHASSSTSMPSLNPLNPSKFLLHQTDRRQIRHFYFPTTRVPCNFFSSNSSFSCWSCGSVGPTSGPFLACVSCGAVQPVDHSIDYFQIFGVKQMFAIKEEILEGIYKDWQKKLHPDLVYSKSEKEKSFAAEQSARVIDAYRTLKMPLSRALYLLKLKGVHVDEEKTVSDPDLLAEMMEMREAVEEANSSEALKKIQSQVQRKLETWSNSFNEAFEKRDFQSAINCSQRMRYYEKAMEEIVKKL